LQKVLSNANFFGRSKIAIYWDLLSIFFRGSFSKFNRIW